MSLTLEHNRHLIKHSLTRTFSKVHLFLRRSCGESTIQGIRELPGNILNSRHKETSERMSGKEANVSEARGGGPVEGEGGMARG